MINHLRPLTQPRRKHRSTLPFGLISIRDIEPELHYQSDFWPHTADPLPTPCLRPPPATGRPTFPSAGPDLKSYAATCCATVTSTTALSGPSPCELLPLALNRCTPGG